MDCRRGERSGAQTPHLTADRLSELIDVRKTTMAIKGRLIRDLIGLDHFDPEFMRRDLVAGSPLVWMLRLDDLIVDARQPPIELQAGGASARPDPLCAGAPGRRWLTKP